MIYLGSLVAGRTYGDPVLADVATIRHQCAVSDVMGGKVFD
jgi:hypothetical protein